MLLVQRLIVLMLPVHLLPVHLLPVAPVACSPFACPPVACSPVVCCLISTLHFAVSPLKRDVRQLSCAFYGSGVPLPVLFTDFATCHGVRWALRSSGSASGGRSGNGKVGTMTSYGKMIFALLAGCKKVQAELSGNSSMFGAFG